MNTPKPCSTCGFLYYDTMKIEDATYEAECVKKLQIGNEKCLNYRHYTKVSMQEKWG